MTDKELNAICDARANDPTVTVSLDGPEVTPLMVEAGYHAYLRSTRSTDTTRATLAAVYRAMHLYRPLSEGPDA